MLYYALGRLSLRAGTLSYVGSAEGRGWLWLQETLSFLKQSKFRAILAMAMATYPEAKVDVTDPGVILRQSTPSCTESVVLG